GDPRLPPPSPGAGRRPRPPGRAGPQAPARRLVLRGQEARARRGVRLSSRRSTRLGAAVLPAPRSGGSHVLRTLRARRRAGGRRTHEGTGRGQQGQQGQQAVSTRDWVAVAIAVVVALAAGGLLVALGALMRTMTALNVN